nr:hypothetical protein [Methanofollis fontis]
MEYEIGSACFIIEYFNFVSFQIEVETRECFDYSFFCSKACGKVLRWICFGEAVRLFVRGKAEVEEGFLLCGWSMEAGDGDYINASEY